MLILLQLLKHKTILLKRPKKCNNELTMGPFNLNSAFYNKPSLIMEKLL